MNTIYTQFKQALQREKQSITTYYTKQNYPCLFRKVNDKDEKEYSTIYYEKDTPINKGQLLTFDGVTFLTMNKESIENDTYCKSSLLQCNTTLEIVLNQRRQYIPCYAGDLKSPTVISTPMMTLLDGAVELMTESTDLVNAIAYQVAFVILGGTYQIVNKYIKSGLTYIYVERTLNAPVSDPVYLITATIEEQYQEDTTATIVTRATIDGVIDDAATLVWTSSDETIATVIDGVITFLSVGTVIVTVNYVEGNVSYSKSINIVAVPVMNTLTITYLGNPELRIGGSNKTFTATLKDDTGTIIPFTPVWTYNWNDMLESSFTIVATTPTIVNTQAIRIKAEDNVDLSGKTFDIICTTSDGLYSSSVTILLFM